MSDGNDEDADKGREVNEDEDYVAKEDDDDDDNIYKSSLFDDNDDNSIDNANIVFHWQGGLVHAASQRVLIRINPTLMVCLNKRQRRRWVSGRMAGRKHEIEIEGRVHVRRLRIP